MTAAATPAPRQKRERGVRESLLSIVLGMEAALFIFVGVAASALDALDLAPAFIGGAVAVVVFVFAARAVRHTWGVWLGWALQVAMILTGLLLPVMWFIGAGFAGLWVWCFVRSGQIERRRAAAFAEAERAGGAATTTPDHPKDHPREGETS